MRRQPTRPTYAAHVVLFYVDSDGVPWVLTIERLHEPFKNHRALPGGHVDHDGTSPETSRHAAARELFEETGIKVNESELRLVGVYDEPHRDPRGWYVSAAYALEIDPNQGIPTPVAMSDALSAGWLRIHNNARLAFDHSRIVQDALFNVPVRRNQPTTQLEEQ